MGQDFLDEMIYTKEKSPGKQECSASRKNRNASWTNPQKEKKSHAQTLKDYLLVRMLLMLLLGSSIPQVGKLVLLGHPESFGKSHKKWWKWAIGHDKLKAENTGLVGTIREKSRTHQQTQELYDWLRQKMVQPEGDDHCNSVCSIRFCEWSPRLHPQSLMSRS